MSQETKQQLHLIFLLANPQNFSSFVCLTHGHLGYINESKVCGGHLDTQQLPAVFSTNPLYCSSQ